jgi:hypothetical protein
MRTRTTITATRTTECGAAVFACALLLAGCGGGGAPSTSGGAGALEAARLVSIDIEPAFTIWHELIGDPPTTPNVPVAFNAAVIFTFAGPLSPTSPLTGGSPLILGSTSGLIPSGVFSVEDDPALPAGNRRRFVFRPQFAPGIPSTACASGYAPGSTYAVSVPVGRFNVAGATNANAAFTSFAVPACGAPGAGFLDPVAGAPTIASTSPATAAAPSAPVAAGATVDVEMNEALDPAFLPASALSLRDVATGATVPGASVAQTLGAGASARTSFSFTPAAPLPAGRTLELVFAAGLRDFAGNAVAFDGPRRFSTIAGAAVAQSIVESFDDADRLGAISPGVVWNGDGSLRFGDLIEFEGDGSDGALVVPPGQTLALDTHETVVVNGTPQSRRGVWNFASLTVGAGATLRLHGPWPAHLRVLGAAQIDGAVRADAGTLNPATNAGAPPYELGPRTGGNNNGGVPGPASIAGGVGNAGGGAGGAASAADQPASPSNYCPTLTAVHTYFGNAGFGPTIGGLPNTDPTDPRFGGGEGGRSGFFPQSFAGEQGGYGGAGGTAGTIGETGQPRVSTGCSNAAVPICPTTLPGGDGLPLGLAQPRPVSAFFIPPIAVSTAGSGGGGGGEKLQTQFPPTNDEQGGGAGGGGGAVRITGTGTTTFGAAAVVSANGAVGASGATLSGHGGSGSGGQIWIQSFGTLTIPTSTSFSVVGPARFGGVTTPGCSLQASGGGGQGLVQIESPGGTVAAPSVSAGAVVQALATATSFTALSAFVDSGAFAPDWTGFVENFVLGPSAGATLAIRYEGAHEAADASGPDLTTLRTTVDGQPGGAPIGAADVDALDGYRYVRFRITAAVPAAAGTAATDVPRVLDVALHFVAP